MRYLLILFLLICSPAWSATQLKKVVAPSGGDYTSLEACMNANEQNLVTADKYFDVEISGTWSSADTTAVIIHNYTTDATRYINIYTTGSARHNGTWDTTKYVLSASNQRAFLIYNLPVYFDGLQVDTSTQFNSNVQGSLLVIKDCLLKSGIYDDGGTYKIYNSVIMRSNYWSRATFYLYNVTLLSSITATGPSNINLYNTIVLGTFPTGHPIYGESGATINVNYSAWTANDSCASYITSGSNNRINQTFSFSDSTNWDYRLLSTDTGAKDFGGSDVSGLGISYSDDIIGTSRPQGASWDIGAFEYVSAGATSSIISIDNATINNATFF